MSLTSSTLRRLAALRLPSEAMEEVLSILADLQQEREARLSKDRARKRRGKSVEVPVEIPPKEKNSNPPVPVANATEGLTPHQLQSNLLWSAGLPMLEGMGCSNKEARSMVGRWLKAAPPAQVLDAIYNAKSIGTKDPIPYITAALKPSGVRKNGSGWYITKETEEYEAWVKYANRISDYSLLSRLKYGDGEIKVPSRWPGK